MTCTLTALEKDNAFKLSVKNISKETGTYRGRLFLKTNYKKRPLIRIPVFGRLLSNLQVIPETIDFGQVHQKQFIDFKAKEPKITRNVIVRVNRGDGLHIEKVGINNCLFQTKIIEMKQTGGYKISVTPFIKKMDKGIVRADLKIYTNNKKHRVIKVPVSITIK